MVVKRLQVGRPTSYCVLHLWMIIVSHALWCLGATGSWTWSFTGQHNFAVFGCRTASDYLQHFDCQNSTFSTFKHQQDLSLPVLTSAHGSCCMPSFGAVVIIGEFGGPSANFAPTTNIQTQLNRSTVCNGILCTKVSHRVTSSWESFISSTHVMISSNKH